VRGDRELALVTKSLTGILCAHVRIPTPAQKPMKRCCVCKNPSFDDEAKAPLCEVCARLLSEHELSEAERAATRMLTTFMRRMANAGLGERMNSLLEALDGFSQKELDAMTAEEAAGYVPFTQRESACAFASLLDLLRVAATGESA
jgi:hypothetical protein